MEVFMSIFESIFIYICTTFSGGLLLKYFSNKIDHKQKLPDYKLEIVKKQFKTYSDIYFKIVKDPIGNSIKNNIRNIEIELLCNELLDVTNSSKTKSLLLSPHCLKCLYRFQISSESNRDKRQKELCETIENDFNIIKTILGYPEDTTLRRKAFVSFMVAINCWGLLLLFLINKITNPDIISEESWNVVGVCCIVLLLFGSYKFYHFWENRYFF